MVRIQNTGEGFSPTRPKRFYYPQETGLDQFPIQHVQIDWQLLVTKSQMVLDTFAVIPAYILNPEVFDHLDVKTPYPTVTVLRFTYCCTDDR
jgi:hypothetical protein